MTERTLGAKAGHLELLKGGKKNKDGKDGKDKKGKEVEVRKGGSKKFGWGEGVVTKDIEMKFGFGNMKEDSSRYGWWND